MIVQHIDEIVDGFTGTLPEFRRHLETSSLLFLIERARHLDGDGHLPDSSESVPLRAESMRDNCGMSEITRRLFASAIAAAAVAPAIVAGPVQDDDGWITIAHGGRNLNGHIYPPEELSALFNQLPGAMVRRMGNLRDAHKEDETGEISISALAGAVSDCASAPDIADGLVIRVKVRWFSHVDRPVGSFLTPTGKTRIEYGGLGITDFMVVKTYSLRFLCISSESAFQRATRIS